jgi:sec-independent protein translocase protein TatB
MIDLGLTKLALIGAVALVVIGPEKLPRVARMAGSLYGRAQRYIRDVKSEVSREIELDELRKMHKDVQEAASTVQDTVSQNLNDIQADISSSWSEGSSTSEYDKLTSSTSPERLAIKARNFRKKKLARSSAVPAWYKNTHGRRARIISGAARVAKYRPAGASGAAASSSYFF